MHGSRMHDLKCRMPMCEQICAFVCVPGYIVQLFVIGVRRAGTARK